MRSMTTPTKSRSTTKQQQQHCTLGFFRLVTLLCLIDGSRSRIAAAVAPEPDLDKENDNYIPSWEELDNRTLPTWYDEAKFGIFLHWGAFSVPAYGSEWFGSYWRDQWGTQAADYRHFVEQTERANFAYPDYAHRFTAELYRPNEWVSAFAASGAQYIVLTSKHHEGYCMWNSTSIPLTWNWNVMDVGPRRDLLGELATAVKQTESPHTKNRLKFGVYHSLYEWYNPLYRADQAVNFTTQQFVDLKTMPELYDLVNRYEPELIWSDGEWDVHSDYWKAREFLHWYATNSTVKDTAVWNDRWGAETLCHHGGFLTCTDRYNPDSYQPRKWENALTVDKTSWGFNRNSTYSDYMTVAEIVHTLIQVVAFNGNMLLNVGPGSDGTISPIFIDRLKGIGEWLAVNGEAIYQTTPWKVCQNDTAASVFYTRKADRLYALFTAWPAGSTLELSCPMATFATRARFIGLDRTSTTNKQQQKTSEQGFLKWTTTTTTTPSTSSHETADQSADSSTTTKSRRLNDAGVTASVNTNTEATTSTGTAGIIIHLPLLTPDIIPCQHAWVVELTHIDNLDPTSTA